MNQTIINQYFPPIEKTGFLKIVSKPSVDKSRQTQLSEFFRKECVPT
jgi:hypothetical protein